MHQTILFKGALALALVVSSVGSASAGWGHGGSWGGSSGGWGGSSGGWGGSSGGGWGGSSGGGGWGSSGGYGGGWGGSSGGGGHRHHGLFARLHAHKASRWGGSSGGGWGGSSGGWGGSSGGGYGSSGGGYGSSGGGWGGYYGGEGMYYSPAIGSEGYLPMEGSKGIAPADVPADAPPPPADADAPPLEGAARRADGTLIVEVPANAKIYVNDRLTSTPGEVREYVSRNLIRGYNYTYEVRAEIERDGQTVSETKRIDLRAGENTRLAFNLAPEASESVETSITVKVPADAKVNLGGSETKATGEVRVFRTSALAPGAEWKDYTIVVTREVDGRLVSKEQTFTLKAGDQKEIDFDFDTTSVADAR